MFLKFNPSEANLKQKPSIILYHVDALQNKKNKDFIDSINAIKICAGKKKDILTNSDAYIELPTTLKEINFAIESVAAKKKFNENSSIKLKGYFLNKNEKKLSKLDKFVILTEKEIQLLELFLSKKKPISKDNILSTVWNYSADADTHTVETHIYRLRKKIFEKFNDENFLISEKNGYQIK